ncbi:MAG TPA: hypothetical protein VI980_04215 [Acidimicrobiia bacterium]|nr:hypothetical protein [Acidimicrobiia bacterium]
MSEEVETEEGEAEDRAVNPKGGKLRHPEPGHKRGVHQSEQGVDRQGPPTPASPA